MTEILIILLAYVFILIVYNIIFTFKKNRVYKVSKKLKQIYSKILIPVEELNIISNNWTEDDEDGLIEIKAIDAMSGNKNLRQIEKSISVLIYEKTLNFKKHVFKSKPVNMSKEELNERLQKIKLISLYYDPKNLDNYFFDFTFLKEKVFENLV